jgi:uncharacterized protein YecE (DUF72 family)
MDMQSGKQFVKVRIGTAGWVVPRVHAAAFAAEGSHLERYARVMNCVEINSTFYRPHQAKTFARWAGSVPEDFRFAVKAPKAVTHEAKLCNCGAALASFFSQLVSLGEKLGPVLVQLPPKQAFDEGLVREFFDTLRELYAGLVVVEPRHASWFGREPERLMREFEVARAMADPAAGSPLASEPGGWTGLRYFRLHGSPRKYWSEYSDEFLQGLAKRIVANGEAGETWVIFDNTAGSHALGDAMRLRKIFLRDVGRPAFR